MQEPIWMDSLDAVVAHDMELAAHGGGAGLRDAGMLESALARPKNLWVYSEQRPSWSAFAAAYAFGISSNHPFVDGNKRTALLMSFAFLETNGIEVIASQEDAYRTILALAAGELSEAELAEWFQRNTAASQKN
jgi:death-on-curing protein